MNSVNMLLTAFATLLIATSVSSRPTGDDCRASDIVFVLDTSSSIWPVDFARHALPFIINVTDLFDIGQSDRQTQVGLVTFGNDYHLQFHLNDFNDKDLLKRKIKTTTLSGGNTFTNKALDYARTVMFTKEHGAREYADHIIIIITDGESDSRQVTETASQKVKESGIQIFAIGVGRQANYWELRNIASDPADKFMFFVGNYEALENVKGQLASRTCAATTVQTTRRTTTTTTEPTTTTSTTTTTTTTKPTTTTTTTTTTTPSTTSTTTTTTEPTTTISTTTTTKPTTPAPTTTKATTTPTTTTTTVPTTTTESKTPIGIQESTVAPRTSSERPIGDQGRTVPPKEGDDCKSKPADIYFILDVSSSLYIKDFEDEVLPFVSKMVSKFDISPSHTRVGVVTFDRGVEPVFGLDEYTNLEELQKNILNIEYTGGDRTDTNDAIAYVRDYGFSPKVARKGVAKIVIVITDGQSYYQTRTKIEAFQAKQTGINMFAIGVGKHLDMDELKAIASEPEEKFVHIVENHNALSTIQDVLTDETCQIKGTQTIIDPKDCNITPTDIMFVFESASKQQTSRKILRSVITNFAEKLKTKSDLVRVGSLTDPCPDEEETSFLKLSDFRRKMAFMIHNTEGQMHSLIHDLRTDRFAPQTTSGRRQVAVLFLDEDTRVPSLVASEAQSLKKQGVEVYVVAVGDVSEYMVMMAASETAEDHIIRVKNYPQLKSLKLNKLWNICSGFESVSPSLPKKRPS